MDKFCDTRGLNFDNLRCDRAGNDKSFFKEANDKDWKFWITQHYTPRTMLQQNTEVETPIQVCHVCLILLQASANIPEKYKNIMYPPAFMLSMQSQGLEVKKNKRC